MGRTKPLCLVLPLTLAAVACSQTPTPGPTPAVNSNGEYLMATVRYLCQQNKSIVADYYDAKGSVAPDGRPVPGGRILMQLSDGRKFSLPQTLSASGTRYADKGESIVFWSKGDTAFVEEGSGKTITYRDCVAQKR